MPLCCARGSGEHAAVAAASYRPGRQQAPVSTRGPLRQLREATDSALSETVATGAGAAVLSV